MAQQGNHNRPVKEFRSGNAKAAIWRNEVEQDGQTVVRFSIKIQKNFRDPQSGKWVNQDINVFPNELANLRDVVADAERYCRLRERGEHAGPATDGQ